MGHEALAEEAPQVALVARSALWSGRFGSGRISDQRRMAPGTASYGHAGLAGALIQLRRQVAGRGAGWGAGSVTIAQ